MNVKKFQKRKEDFICDQCQTSVVGDGFTNHCPKCLWSKHVDIFPGDRLEPCKGAMKPIGVLKQKGKDVILHECIKCGYRIKNGVSEKDDFSEVIKVSKLPIKDK